MNYDQHQVILSSGRLLFRQHIMADMNAYCAMEMDPEMRKYVGGYPRLPEEAERRFINAVTPVAGRLSMWATVLKENGRYIGRCGVYPHLRSDGGVIAREGTLAFYIAREYWRQGFATEAGLAFMEFGFNELHLKRIVANVQAGNDVSVHILEKLGFALESTEMGERSFYHFELKNPVT
jgi:[ribosomal protein S5]-alanine N-acetyltransferase